MRNPELKVGLPSSSADECEKADWEQQQQQQQSPRTSTSQDPATSSTDPAMHDRHPPTSSLLSGKHLVSTIDIEMIGFAASFGDDSEKRPSLIDLEDVVSVIDVGL